MNSPVLQALANVRTDPRTVSGDREAAAAVVAGFIQYCDSRGISWRKVRPATIDLFAIECIGAASHVQAVPLPRSWPKKLEPAFSSLPHVLQAYIAEREQEQTAVVRRAQNEAAALRKALATMPKETPHEVA